MTDTVKHADDPVVALFRPYDRDHLCSNSDPASATFISSLLETSASAVAVVDCAFEVVAANSAARRLFSMGEQRLPASAARFFPEECLNKVEDLFSSSSDVQTASFRTALARGGEKTLVNVKADRLKDPAGRTLGVTLAFSATLYDKCAVPGTCMPERIEALGLYTAGVIHEFNNLLSVISGRAGLGLMAIGPKAKNRALENVITASRRAEHITRNLLTYVQHHKPDVLLVDLARPVQDAVSLLEIEFNAAHVEIVRDLHALPCVKCDPVQIAQVCFNLLRNAKDAMPEGGVVTVKLRKYGGGAVLSFTDNGRGIPPETRSRLFEPFVSHGRTGALKPSGTGLGLFVAREIVHAHGGEITVESVVARGSTFSVRLPINPRD